MGRIQHASKFDDPLTELLFCESFARAAWRVDELDVALDMAHEEWRLAQSLPGQPRKEVAAALQGVVYLQAGLPADAVNWFERAEALFRARHDWERVVPMLRGKALALEALGRDDDALSAFTELLDLTVRGVGVPKPDKPFFGFLAPEIAGVNPNDVTRAPYGFSANVEEELYRALRRRAPFSCVVICAGRGPSKTSAWRCSPPRTRATKSACSRSSCTRSTKVRSSLSAKATSHGPFASGVGRSTSARKARTGQRSRLS